MSLLILKIWFQDTVSHNIKHVCKKPNKHWTFASRIHARLEGWPPHTPQFCSKFWNLRSISPNCKVWNTLKSVQEASLWRLVSRLRQDLISIGCLATQLALPGFPLKLPPICRRSYQCQCGPGAGLNILRHQQCVKEDIGEVETGQWASLILDIIFFSEKYGKESKRRQKRPRWPQCSHPPWPACPCPDRWQGLAWQEWPG